MDNKFTGLGRCCGRAWLLADMQLLLILKSWVMSFADDLVICEHSRAEVEMQLERWRETFESHGLRVSRGKTEYMPCPERDQTISIQEKEVKTDSSSI